MSDQYQQAREADFARVKAAADQLSEHFDSVQIFVTAHESGTYNGTRFITHGNGNYFARVGVVRDWLVKEEEQARQEIAEEQEE